MVRPPVAGLPKLVRPANLVLALWGMPAALTARSDMRMLCAPGATGIRPWIAPARDKSAPEARTKLPALTPPRPNSPARMPVTPFTPLTIRALRKEFTTFMLLTTLTPPIPRPYHGRKASNGASGTHPTLANPKPNPTPIPTPPPQPKNPTMAGRQ
jgi:hypothetical protein